MALIAFDGFDNYNATGTDLTSRAQGPLQWTVNGASVASPGRTGTGTYVAMVQNGQLQGTFATPLATGRVGFAMRIPIVGSLIGTPSVALIDAATGQTQMSVVFNPARAGFDIYRGQAATLIAQSANNAINLDAWNYVEFLATIGSSAGALTISVNGEVVATLTGLNNQTSVNSHFDGINFHGPTAPANNQLQVDDFILCDLTTGPGIFPFNTFVGDVRSVQLSTIGAGASTQWTPLTGANWQEVSEVHNDGDTSYNSSLTVGQEDLFNFTALSGTIASVLAIQITGSYRKDDAAVRQVTQQLVSGPTQVAGATYTVPGAYVYFTDLFVLDPNTTANWSVANVNLIQAGYLLTT